jgi:hypothetical protein
VVYSNFSKNSAGLEGGVIKFTNAKPEMFACSYTTNQAPYGPNFASYPIRLSGRLLIENKTQDESLSIQRIVTGEIITHRLVFELKDEFNQTVSVPQNEEELIILFFGLKLKMKS